MAARDFAADQQWELDWWNGAINTFGEEAKQLTYAPRMGLVNTPQGGKWPVYDLAGKSVLDLGGGPVSMLLKTVNGEVLMVVDPCPYPDWVRERYFMAGVTWIRDNAETFGLGSADDGVTRYDECWIYNVLQHVVEPEAVVATAKRHAKLLRIFEWLETETAEGHPHTLHAHELNDWIGGTGEVGFVNENGATGLAYWGEFSL